MNEIRTVDDLLRAEREQQDFATVCRLWLAALSGQIADAAPDELEELRDDLAEIVSAARPAVNAAMTCDFDELEKRAPLEAAYQFNRSYEFVRFVESVEVMRDELTRRIG